jgi:DtxR family Mn-dependent transcriptional regulator
MVGHFQEFEDEYLETMYEFHESEPLGVVRTGDLAARLGVSPASATEMVQRLASRGLLEYIPYKGARLSKDGLVHGQKMKRRHRLAEVLLDHLPYEGNAHETACRLEHAIDDDMEVALSRLVGAEATDPSGRPIPPPTEDIELRLREVGRTVCLSELEPGSSGELVGMLLPAGVKERLEAKGLVLGSHLSKESDRLLTMSGEEFSASEAWLRGLFIRVDENTT